MLQRYVRQKILTYDSHRQGFHGPFKLSLRAPTPNRRLPLRSRCSDPLLPGSTGCISPCPQLVKDNLLGDQEVALDHLVRCAENRGHAGEARSSSIGMGSFISRQALPCDSFAAAQTGSHMVLLRV